MTTCLTLCFPYQWTRFKTRLCFLPVVTGSKEAAIYEGIERADSDRRQIKHRYSCFHHTDLLSEAHKEGITHFLICGYQLSACVLATALDAYQADFHPVVMKDCVMDTDRRELEYFLDYFKRADCLGSAEEWIEKFN